MVTCPISVDLKAGSVFNNPMTPAKVSSVYPSVDDVTLVSSDMRVLSLMANKMTPGFALIILWYHLLYWSICSNGPYGK